MEIVILLGGIGIYLLIGAVFAVAFVSVGCGVLDRGAKGAGLGFRLLIFPASILLWPLLLNRWLQLRQTS